MASKKQLTVFVGGKVRKIKPELDKQALIDTGFFQRNPKAIIVKRPSENTLWKWSDEGIAKAVDGCRVEPDGKCKHGYPSWLLVEGLI